MSEAIQAENAKKKKLEELMRDASAAARGRLALHTPIMDGDDRKFDELAYDFEKLTGWEFASAIDAGTIGNKKSVFNLRDTEALSLFAAAAAKCTDGLDATDIRQRIGTFDATIAIKIAATFFNFSSLAGSMRITSA